MIRLPSGKLLSPMGFHFILRSFKEIEQFRLIQESSAYLVLQLACQKNLLPERLSQLRSQLTEHLHEPVQVDIQFVDFMREDTSKCKTFISKLLPADR